MASTADLVKQSNGQLATKETFLDKIKKVKDAITVEPLLATYLIAAVICLPALLTLELEKACRSNLKYNETVCRAIRNSEHENYTDVNTEIVVLLSNVHSVQVPCQNFIPCLLVLFIGAFSDRHQIRKPFMLLPLLGELIAVCGCLLCVIYMDEWPVEIQGLLQTIVPSFFGGSTMMIMAVFSYVADTSTLETRTFRVAVVQTTLNVALPLGQFLSPIFFTHFDYVGVFLITAGLYLFAIFYGVFFVKEKKYKFDKSKGNAWLTLVADIADPTNFVETFIVLFKGGRKNIGFLLTILAMFFIVTGMTNVDFSALFLYLQRVFHWTANEFSYYSTFGTLVHLFGIVIFVPLFTKVLNLSDATILIFTFLDKIVATIILGLANSNILLYLSCLVSIISNITTVALRSLATKIVSEEDLGKVQSLIGVVEALGIAAITPTVNLVFVKTLNTVPSAFIFCQAMAYAVCVFLASSFYLQKTRTENTANDVNHTTAQSAQQNEGFQVTHM